MASGYIYGARDAVLSGIADNVIKLSQFIGKIEFNLFTGVFMNKLSKISWLALSLVTMTELCFAETSLITGAGATFPYPLYVKWAQAYQAKTGISINYQPIGSGGGIQQIQAKTVDFGASDKPLTNIELSQSHLTQFPAVVGGVVTAINLPALANHTLILSGPILAEIYLGKITQWNDPKIQALNPGLVLPKQIITVIHRSDGSGTTFLFTHYLGEVSPEWKEHIGSDTAVAWPVGAGGKGNEGVTAYVQRIKGSIGYVEYAYARQNHLNFAQLQNRDGKTVTANLNSFQSAAAYAHWSPLNHFAEILTNEPGANSWPIVGATFILMNTPPVDTQKSTAVLRFFNWSFKNGNDPATNLDYVPLPPNVVQIIQNNWQKEFNFTSAKQVL